MFSKFNGQVVSVEGNSSDRQAVIAFEKESDRQAVINLSRVSVSRIWCPKMRSNIL